MNKYFLTLVAGIGIGLLIAPARGSETLRKIREGIDEYKDKEDDLAGDVVNQGEKAYNRGKSKINQAM
jgi:gas vesicle protein